MTDNEEKRGDNVLYDNYYPGDCDCNSSEGGSVYQEIYGRLEESAMYSTDDEFMDATETIRSPLLEVEQLSVPVLKQLNEDKEQTRYILLNMPSSESESLNSSLDKCKEISSEKDSKPLNDESAPMLEVKDPHRIEEKLKKIPASPTKIHKSEKGKSARTLRLPSALASPTVKTDRPARGDGSVSTAASRIPVARTSVTKLRQQTSEDQNTAESESSSKHSKRQPGLPSKILRLPTASSQKEEESEEEIVTESSTGTNKLESECGQILIRKPPQLPIVPKPNTASSDKGETQKEEIPASHEKTVNEWEREETEKNGTEEAAEINNSPTLETPINSSEDTSMEKKICELPVSSKEAYDASTNENPSFNEKPRTKRARSHNNDDDKDVDLLAPGDTINVAREGIDTKRMRIGGKPPFSRENQGKYFSKVSELSKDVERRKKAYDAVRERMTKRKLNLATSKEKEESKDQENNQQCNADTVNLEKQDLQLLEDPKNAEESNNTSLLGNRSREAESKKSSEKNSRKATPEPSPRQAPPLIKSLAERRQQIRKSRERANGEMAAGNAGIKEASMPEIKPLLFKQNQLKTNQLVRSTLAEKRQLLMMKKREEACHKSDTSDQQTNKRFERLSREKKAANNQKPQSSNQKPSSTTRKPSPGSNQSNERPSNMSSSFTMEEVKPLSATTKVTLISLNNVYKTNYKRYEEQMGEMENAKKRVSISLEKLNALRNQIIQNSGEDPGEVIPPFDTTQSIVPSASITFTTTKGMNTEVLQEEIAETFIVLGNNQRLRTEIETLRKELEETKQLGYSKKKEADTIADLKKKIREMSLTLKIADKRQQELETKMEEQQEHIAMLTNENKQIAELNKILKQRDQQLLNMKKKIEDKNKELENALKKGSETTVFCDNAIQEEIYKREKIHSEFKKVLDEKSSIEKQLFDLTDRFVDFEEREECLNTRLENEKKKVAALQEEISRKDEQLTLMEKKFIEMEATSSTSVLGLTEQIAAKDAILNDFEALRANFQSQNREMCCLISDIFAIMGKNYEIDEIQSALSTGKFSLLREEVLKTIEERIEGSKATYDARSKVAELRNQVKELQVELEENKMMWERLTNIISRQKPWEQERTWGENRRPWSSEKVSQARNSIHSNMAEIPIRESIFHRDGDTQSVVPSIASSYMSSDAAMARNNFNELFVLLEGKRRALLQMERKLNDMEEVHSHCAQKRTRNETRIAQLEMMLAALGEFSKEMKVVRACNRKILDIYENQRTFNTVK